MELEEFLEDKETSEMVERWRVGDSLYTRLEDRHGMIFWNASSFKNYLGGFPLAILDMERMEYIEQRLTWEKI